MIIARTCGDAIPVSAEAFLDHIYGAGEGWLVAFSGRQARIDHPQAPANSLAKTTQRYFKFPTEMTRAADHLRAEARRGRDSYVGVHLYREHGNRRSANAASEVSTLWLDEDSARLPENGPRPTAIVASSHGRRHAYWKLSRPVPAGEAAAHNTRLAVFAGGDTGKAGLATVLRPPDTTNFKRYPRLHEVSCTFTGAEPLDPEVA